MQNLSAPSRIRRLGTIGAALVLAIFGVASLAKGLAGRSTVHSALEKERVVGSSYMTPRAIAVKAREAGLREVALPACSVAGKPVDDGTSARCFAEYMRIDALMATHGATYAQMPQFATKDGKGTNDPKQARQTADGTPVDNPARDVWVTQAALSTALNTSYMAEQVSLFGIGVGAAFLLVSLALAALGTGSMRIASLAFTRRRAAEPAPDPGARGRSSVPADRSS